MKLLDYIKGNRKGKDAHHIERQAMEDPFLADALEGLDSIEGNHTKQIEALQKQLTKKLQPKTYYFRTLSIAASILICVSIGGFFIFQNIHKMDQFAIKTNTEAPNLHEITQEIAYSDEIDTLLIYMPERETQRVKTYREREDLPMMDLQMEKLPVSVSTLSVVSDVEAKKSDGIPAPSFVMEDEKSQELSEVVVIAYGTNKNTRITGSVVTEASSKELPDIKPSPVMGMRAYQNYIKDNMKRPTDAVCGNKKGTVELEFYVDSKGTPININIKKSVCVSMDIEAIRLLQQGPKWTVGSRITELKIKF